MRSSGESRVVRPTKRAREALEASQVPPTFAPSAEKRRQLYTDPHDSQDLDLYTASQIPPSQTQQPPQPPPAQYIPSSPPPLPAASSSPWPRPPSATQQELAAIDEEQHEDEDNDDEALDEVLLSEPAEPDPLANVNILRYCLKVKLTGKHGSGAKAVTCEHTNTWQSVRTAKHNDGYRDMMLWCHEKLAIDGGWRIGLIQCTAD
jgi:hypothetical protein